MLKGMGDIGALMKFQKEYKNIQEKITDATLVGLSPNGKVHASMCGDYRIKEISIDPEYFKSVDVRELETMILTAVNNAVATVKDLTSVEMKKIASGLNIPGLMDFLNKG